MIPSLVAGEIRETLLDYLKTTWSLADQELQRALLEFLSGPQGMFKGPYLRLALPFERASDEARIPLDIAKPYTPYRHQLEAWQRLSTQDGREPDPTLVVTGTGSGKTEAFLMPILDHCYRAKAAGERGIKAIVLYPMNALASDQARRIAEVVWKLEHPSADDAGAVAKAPDAHLSVGMYVGGEGGKETGHRMMGKEHVIDTAKQLLIDPPDILLTNYKMLDLLLLRPKDRALWKSNGPGTLRYLVLDELHTYDGAQGTDVACLIRRLKARLGGGGSMCPVGTSATVSSGHGDGHAPLLDFASKIFGIPVPEDAVIGETRRTPAAFFGLFGKAIPHALPSDATGLVADPKDDIESYITRVATLWFPKSKRLAAGLGGDGSDSSEDGIDRALLAELVMCHPLARTLIESASQGVRSLAEVDGLLAAADASYGARTDDDRAQLLDSLLAMLSWSKSNDGRPLLSVQVQMWIREVRRLVREVCSEPRFVWREDTPLQEGDALALPMYVCRSCGHSGWVTVQEELADTLESDVVEIGRMMLRRHRAVRYLHIDKHAAGADAHAATDDDKLPGIGDYVCKGCRVLSREETCRKCGEACLHVHVHRAESKKTPPKDLQQCPACGTDFELGILASRAATVASVAVGHLYSTPFNSDRKLLAFSDSVQDASHRAGFFSGRTYRMGLRRAMLAVVPSGESVPLLDVAERMWERWAGEHGPAETMAAFWPRDLEYLDAYGEYMAKVADWKQEGKGGKEPAPKARLQSDVLARISWEVNREFGVAARIGRTLERSGCAALDVDPVRFEEAIEKVASRLPEKLGVVSDVGEVAWRFFVAGLLQRLRLRGGVYDELLRGYFRSGGAGVFLSKDKEPLLSPFGRFTTRPSFWASQDSERFDGVFPKSRQSWFVDWASRSLGMELSVQDAADLYRALVPILFEADLLEQHQERKQTYWGLAPEALRLSRDSEELRCAECGFAFSAIVGSPMHMIGGTCLRYRCEGQLAKAGDANGRVQSYYKRFYERAALSRVRASEHTGLLSRGDREQVEFDFQHDYRPDAPNMLSCTPTLEMGIDIGDLSATMLMSVPPTPASYLQRIGRAGRKTGNALVLTVTSIKPHDRYFFESPEAAMAGRVDPPGCYLDAPEILKRQALAFCMDAWTKTGKAKMPGRVRDLIMGDEKTRFPKPLFDFIDANRQSLVDGFFAVFAVSEDTRSAIAEFMSGSVPGGSAMEMGVVALCKAASKEREELRRVRDRLRKQIQQLSESKEKVPNAEEEAKELDRERYFVGKALVALQEQYALGYLCEQGALPNYAFPETGVKLQAFVAQDQSRGPAKEQPAVVRAARTAIRELAPFNKFYSNRLKVKIDNVNVGTKLGKRAGDAIREWQFCKECGHMQEVRLLESDEHCPRCKAPDWQEKGRQRKLVRMKQVASYSRARDATFSDESDEREREYYESKRYFDSAPGKAKYAQVSKADSFGFELQPEFIQREINFGRQHDLAEKMELGGEEVAEVSFIVCAECGQVHTPKGQLKAGERESKHRPWCKARAKAEDKQPLEEVHLYREVTSEALLVLLPVAMFDYEVRLPNLEAAMSAGLRKFFGGDPNHLELSVHSEPTVSAEGARRRFLVVFDTVPGGTGVLVELARDGGAKLKKVFECAREILVNCECAEREDAKACYLCLYGHRRQQNIHVLDRERALGLVEKIIASFDGLGSVHSIGDLPIETILESELEERFWLVLEDWAKTTEGVTWTELENEEARLSFAGHSWRVQPQVFVNEAFDVPVESRPDFVFWPENAPKDVLPVAVFADGATYHVQPDKDRGRIADDFRKRSALVASQRFTVWSFAWHDLDWQTGGKFHLGPWLDRESVRRDAQTLAGKLGEATRDTHLKTVQRIAMEKGAIEVLFAYLQAPSQKRWRTSAAIIGAAMLSKPLLETSAEAIEGFAEAYRNEVNLKPIVGELHEGGKHRAATQNWSDYTGRLLVHANTAEAGGAVSKPSVLRCVLRLDDASGKRRQKGFLSCWRQFLRAHNVMQFLPGLEVVTTEQIDDFVPHEEPAEAAAGRRKRPSTLPVTAALALSKEVLADLHEADESLWPQLEQLVAGGAIAPEIPYEHGDENDWGIEVGWLDAKVGVFLSSDDWQSESAEVLRRAGWTLFEASDAGLGSLRKALGMKGGGA